jgi:hypothetical protein
VKSKPDAPLVVFAVGKDVVNECPIVTCMPAIDSSAVSSINIVDLWHRRLGHLGLRVNHVRRPMVEHRYCCMSQKSVTSDSSKPAHPGYCFMALSQTSSHKVFGCRAYLKQEIQIVSSYEHCPCLALPWIKTNI